MRSSKAVAFRSILLKRSQPRRARQFGGLLFLGLMLAGCAGDGESGPGQIGYVEGFIGGVVADEPRAALVGRDILTAGGSAADAAVAMYFTLSVTMPSVASLGGGGVCLVHDQASGADRTLEFLPRAPTDVPAQTTRPSAVPANPRGFFALYAEYGRLRWGELVGGAAQLARFGTPVSRTLGRDLAAAGEALLQDLGMVRIFGDPETGGTVREGRVIEQVDLAAVLGRISTQGPGDFYTGQTGSRLVEAVAAAGGSLDKDDLRTVRPVWRDTVQVPTGNHVAHFPSPPPPGGAVAAAMWSMLQSDDRFANADASERVHLLAETAMRAYADRAGWMTPDGRATIAARELGNTDRLNVAMRDYRSDRHTQAGSLDPVPVQRRENPATTTIIAVDRAGNAVACGVTMNGLFGTGRIAPGTGIVLATVPDGEGHGALSLGPMIVANPHTKRLYWAGAANGGVAGPTALINVAARALLGEEALDAAIADPRVHHGGEPDITYVENGMDGDVVQVLRTRGHQIKRAPDIGRVNAFYCPEGLPENEGCQIATDPRGFGLGITTQR